MTSSRWPYVTGIIAAIALAAHASPQLSAAWTFDRGAGFWPIGGLLTCHLTHWGSEHLVWNLAVFMTFGAWCEKLDRGHMVLTLLIASILIPPAVMLTMPNVHLYRGLSGVDTALFALVASLLLRQARFTGDNLLAGIGAVAIGATLAKPLLELSLGHALFVDQTSANFAVTPVAHIVGAITGAAMGWLGRERTERSCNASYLSSLSAR